MSREIREAAQTTLAAAKSDFSKLVGLMATEEDADIASQIAEQFVEHAVASVVGYFTAGLEEMQTAITDQLHLLKAADGRRELMRKIAERNHATRLAVAHGTNTGDWAPFDWIVSGADPGDYPGGWPIGAGAAVPVGGEAGGGGTAEAGGPS